MEYERIHGVQTGVISPSKLRMKLIGIHSHWRSEGVASSSVSSPNKLEELEHSKGSLLADRDDDGDTGKFFLRQALPLNQKSVFESRGGAACFEFNGEERPLPALAVGPFHRPIPSKWYDAEKWIIARQPAQPNLIKKTLMQHRYGDQPPVEVVPEVVVLQGGCVESNKADCPSQHSEFPFNTLTTEASSCPAGGVKSSVLMKETGTEMTPMASQEPSRTATPKEASTPSRSPAGSHPTTPRAAPPVEAPSSELSDEERRMKTRREILALGLQLGKMNIAAWASKADEAAADLGQPGSVDSEAWEEADRSKHNARFKREEVKIQVWESHQKAKAEAKMKQVEARAEKVKAQAHERMIKKLSMIKQRAGEKLAAAEARRLRHLAATSCQAEHIRRTGQPPPPPGCRLFCCLWFS